MLNAIRYFVLAVLLATGGSVAIADAPPQFDVRKLPAEAVPETANRSYRLFSPTPISGKSQKFPLVVYLHGSGAKGDDNRKPLDEPVVKRLVSAEIQQKYPCFVLVPQCRAGDDTQGRPNNWVKWENQIGTTPAQWTVSEREPSDQLLGAMAALKDALKVEGVDASRVYLTGVSMGGSGSWNWGAREPERFAAVVTVCGLSDIRLAPSLAKTPVWCFHGSEDAVAPASRTRQMVQAIEQAGGTIKFTEYAGAGHNIAGRVLGEKGMLEWLFAQRREDPK